MKKQHKAFTLALGIWKLRNGSTVEIRKREVLKYENPQREFILWTGWCEDAHIHISWLDIGKGRYSANDAHPFDIVAYVAKSAAVPTSRSAA